MTVPFENDTGNIVRKLARKSLKSEKRRNLMVVIAVALASCLICFSIVMALSTRQIEKNHVEDTYEAVYTRITEEDVSTLKGLDDFSRVGEYYMLAVEPAEQGYNASYIYCDEETMYIARDQMKLLEGRLPQKEDEVVVSRYFLSNYAADAGIGEKVMLIRCKLLLVIGKLEYNIRKIGLTVVTDSIDHPCFGHRCFFPSLRISHGALTNLLLAGVGI